ncbi:M3 family metallopeptidase [Sphingomonas sp. 2R-10]|uniref:M3 family metallopeptidase n=1 Tax=Sphingomonas sp. 2R-10 TaxID=3045148 RepID=UPI0019D314CF|nr:M3 family metallopeptidase [Sphingomonas sp. 2R-10]MDJ0276473.1 M3 family metallopeptidase [Sphingomonas sp. 2R-10]
MHRRTLLVSAAMLPLLNTPLRAAEPANPLLGDWTNGIPPYRSIRPAHYRPAFDAALKAARADFRAIAVMRSAPTFANTIEAMERSGQRLARVSSAFFNVSSADATPEIQAIEEAVVPDLTRFSNETSLDPVMFARVDRLYEDRASLGLDAEQQRLLEETHKRYVRAGAALPPAARARIAAINEELATLGVQFGQKLLADQKASGVVLTEAEVAGLPADQKSAAATAAKAAGKTGYLVPATRSAVEPFLTVATDRGARQKVFSAFDDRGANANDNNTAAIIRRLVELRIERAKLMGVRSHAAFVLQDAMAKTPEAATDLLMRVYRPALTRAREEEAALLALARADGVTRIEPWDWRFYAEKERQRRYSLDEAAVKQYFPLDGMVAALMDTTRRLYGIEFVPRSDVPVYADGVKVWEVREGNGAPIGLFYADWFARPTKRPGAWMNSLRDQSTLLGQQAIVVNNCNYTPPAPGERALISLDDAETLFHEFGHGLHGLFSKVRYPSLSGTSVTRDFVEFPSQVHEHWVSDPTILRAHARNAAGQPMPEPMLRSLLEARTFNQGCLTVQQLSSAILDMRLHSLGTLPADFDAVRWEKAQLADLGVPHAVGMRHRLPHFSHIFDGGYSAGYYAYTWAEVLDADGFAAFEETGDVFDPVLAKKLRDEVLSRGNSRDPAASYVAFRGRMPDATALLRNRGLA